VTKHEWPLLASCGAMPLTFFAHQVPVLPLKMVRPAWFDATALCLGAAAPDLGYPFSRWLPFHTHSVGGVVTWGLAWTLVASVLVRRFVAPVTFAHVPDLGMLRLHSLRVLPARRPPVWQTVTSAFLGAASHVLLDSFTHTDRFGASLLRLNGVLFTVEGSPITTARLLQYIGVTIGPLVGLALLAAIGRSRRLESWYGPESVRAARSFTLRPRNRLWFWGVVALGPPAGLALRAITGGYVVFSVIDATLAAVVVASMLPRCRPAAAVLPRLRVA
jgi:hypothetical protein